MVLLICLFIFVGVPISIMYFIDPDAVTEAFKRSPKYNVQDEMNLFNDAEWVKKLFYPVILQNKYGMRTNYLKFYVRNMIKK